MMKMITVVCGPESSGSRWVARACAQALGIAGYGDWDGHGHRAAIDRAVVHLSLPNESVASGARAFIRDPFAYARDQVGWGDARFTPMIITLRAHAWMFESKVRTHQPDRQAAFIEQEDALDLCDFFFADYNGIAAQYETLVDSPSAGFAELFRAIGAPADAPLPPVVDGNAKYRDA